MSATECQLLRGRSFSDIPLLLEPGEAAKVLGVSLRTIRRMLADGRLPKHTPKGSTRIRIRRDHVLALLGITAD